METLQFPIGQWSKPDRYSALRVKQQIAVIKKFPNLLRKTIAPLKEEQLGQRYRKDGWTIRQVVHHLADSHINSIIRFKLTLTEDTPTIKPYLEAKWAELADTKLPVKYSMQILHGVHARWSVLLRSIDKAAMHRTFIHPEHNDAFRLYEAISLYAWHCGHHLEHIRIAIRNPAQ